MRDLFVMWRSTRMVVLAAITGGLYAASLVAFKFLSILPGVTEIRPGVAFVLLCSILFGPAGAWGAAIGNTIGDLAGGLGPGTAVGFVANLVMGLVPYKLYRALAIEDPTPRDGRTIAAFVAASFASAAACGVLVGWGIQAVGLWPIAFKVLANTITATNLIVNLLLAFFLVRAIYPRTAALGLRWQDIMDVAPARPSIPRAALGWAMVAMIALALIAGDARELGLFTRLGPDPGGTVSGFVIEQPPLEAFVLPPVLLLLAACAVVD
ncbi:MAG TPA: QueT transporter family protein [Planctomycetota bacterium]|nr:QueT transporter family protein [Planctomycetota bacterium]